MKKSVILLTGCAGFIGSNLARYFILKKKNVVGIDNLTLGKASYIKNILNNKNFIFKKLNISKLKEIDIFLKKITKINKIESIWHLAANSDIKDGFKNPDIDFENTFLTTYNLIKLSKKYKIKKFVFASSSAVYGDLKKKKKKKFLKILDHFCQFLLMEQ